MPDAIHNLVPMSWDGNLIPFETIVPYSCKQGMKFVEDYDKVFQEAKCKEENLWDAPTEGWKTCAPSK